MTPPTEPRTRTHEALADAVRLAALHATDIRSAARAEALQPVVRLAARALRVPVAQINVLTADAQVPVAACTPADPAPGRWTVPVGLEASYCQHVVASAAPLLIPDARIHPLVRDSVATLEAGIVAYAGVPLRAPAALGPGLSGRVLGSVCVVDCTPRQWTRDDVALLEDLADAVTAELGVRAEAAAEAARGVATAASAALHDADLALAESEARFRTMADSMPQLAWMADEGGEIFWYNRRWYEYTGTSPERMRAAGWDSAHHPEHHDRVVRGFREAVAARRPWEDTFPLRGADGTHRWFLSRALPVREEGTGRLRWFGTNTDVTERIEAEAERERLLRREQEARLAAEQASRAKGAFLATMSHELRTPLNAIGGYAELLTMGLRGPVTEAQRSDLERIRHSQRHLLGLINDILNQARLESATVRFDVRDVAVAAALQDVSPMVLPQASAKGLRFRVDPCPPALAVRADREKLRQVLLNLLSNAIKFTAAPGGVRISCEADEDSVRFVIRDTGIGIPPEELAHIFEPFVQVRAELTRTAEGAGLGLSISRDLARGMGGDITVASEIGAGSVFTLALPRATDVAAEAAVAHAHDLPVAEVEARVHALVERGDLHGALGYLNAQTSHRFTGLYRFDGELLRSVGLFDREDPSRRRGGDAPLGETYCAVVATTGESFAMSDARQDPRVAGHPAGDAAVSYCGALVRDADGVPIGTLCSFDVEARPVPSHEIPQLEAAAPLLATLVVRDAERAAARTGPPAER